MMQCASFEKCGGCSYINQPYEQSLKAKHDAVEKLFPGYKINPVIGMKNPYHYRNKVYAAFSLNGRGHVIAGMYEENSHEIVKERNCLIQNETANRIIEQICHIADSLHIRPYDEDTGEGVLRHAYLRISHSTNKALVVLVIGSRELPASKKFVSQLLAHCPQIESIVLNYNSRRTSMVLGEHEHILYGRGFITDEIDGLSFRISSRSFYQVNPVQTEILYRTAIDQAGIDENSIVLDACCGIGTITLLAAKKAKMAAGVEINPASIRDAVYNAHHNHITNAYFYCADASEFITQIEDHIDVVLMDPPRSGLTSTFMSALNRLGPKRIVYISCNPETQARDLKEIKNTYQIKSITPVDMFPFTKAVENICLLERR